MSRLFPYMHVENFLDEDLSQEILAYAIAHKDIYTQSQIGKEGRVNKKVRISHVTRELGPWEAVIQDKIEAFYPKIREGLGMADFAKRKTLRSNWPPTVTEPSSNRTSICALAKPGIA